MRETEKEEEQKTWLNVQSYPLAFDSFFFAFAATAFKFLFEI